MCKGHISTEAKCKLCDVFFSVAGSRFSQVLQHARGLKHVSRSAATGQTRLQVADNGTVTLQPGTGRAFCHDDQVTQAEIVILFRLVMYNYSFASHDDLIEVLKYLFPEDTIIRDMSLASTKSAYGNAYGLGAYYHSELVNDISQSYFSLTVDKITTQQNKKTVRFARSILE